MTGTKIYASQIHAKQQNSFINYTVASKVFSFWFSESDFVAKIENFTLEKDNNTSLKSCAKQETKRAILTVGKSQATKL